MRKRKVIVLAQQKNQKWNRRRQINLSRIASRSGLGSNEQLVYLVKGNNTDIGKIWQTLLYHPDLKRPEMVLDPRPCTDEKGVTVFKVMRAIYDSYNGRIIPTMTEMADLKLVVTGTKRDSLTEYKGEWHNNIYYPKTSVWELEAFVFQPPNRARPDKAFAELPNNDFSRLKTWTQVVLSYDSARAHGVMMLKEQKLPFTMQKHFLYEVSRKERGEDGEIRSKFEIMGQQQVFSPKVTYIVRDISDLDLTSGTTRNIQVRIKPPSSRKTPYN